MKLLFSYLKQYWKLDLWQALASGAVLAAFNGLLDGIRHADVKAATNAYQNSPRLLLFNYNGTVTKGWDQLKANREATVRDLTLTERGRVRTSLVGPEIGAGIRGSPGLLSGSDTTMRPLLSEVKRSDTHARCTARLESRCARG